MQKTSIRLAEQTDAPSIARMLKSLTDEIITETGAQHFHIDIAATEQQCRLFLADGHYTVLLGRSLKIKSQPMFVSSSAQKDICCNKALVFIS